ncbi:MAG: DinB family protein [Gemmatimonadaceae bacterium]
MDRTLTRDDLLAHWLGHRRVTRRTIEAFPDDKSFTSFSAGGMRPFAVLVNEFLSMSVPTLTGIVSGTWPMEQQEPPATRMAALERWDADTTQIEALWPQIPQARLQETDTAFGQWTMPVWSLLFYIIDNEIHHRAQAYVYLRALGVEPPQFPDRS